jgi:Tetracyclin repressor-like, C-terminal domain
MPRAGARIVRAALHGFIALEANEGFGIPLDLDESFARLVSTLDRGSAEPATLTYGLLPDARCVQEGSPRRP